MGPKPEPETLGSPVSTSEPVLPIRNAAAGGASSAALSQTPSSTSSTTTDSQTVPVPDSVESALLSGLPAGPTY
eukprot:2659952-Amphidinium_carterae.2